MGGDASLAGQPIKVYRRRYYMLLVLSMVAFLNNAIFVSFSSIAVSMQTYFNQTTIWINALSWCFVLCDFVLALPALGFIQRFGCRGVVLGSSILHFVGCGMRFFASFSSGDSAEARATYFWVLLAGQCLISIAQPALNAVPPQIASDWFGDDERSVATAVASMSSLVGFGGGYALFAFWVGAHIKESLWKATLVEFCFSGVLLVMSFFYQQRPPTPPSRSCHETGDSFMAEVVTCVRNPQFLVLLAVFAIPFGLFVSVWSTLEEILRPLGISVAKLPLRAGIIGLTMIGGGIVGALLLGHLMDRYRQRAQGAWYGWGVRVMVTTTVVAFVGFHLCIRFKTPLGASVAVGTVCGMAALALMPACIECGVEMTYPVSEANSGGLLLMMGNITGTLYILALTLADNITTSFMACTLSAFAAVVLLFFFRPQYLRLKMEQSDAKLYEQQDSSPKSSETQKLLTADTLAGQGATVN